MNPAVFQLRVMQIAFIVSVLLFALVLHIIHPAPHPVNPSLQWAIALCAIASAQSGFYVQRMFLRVQSQSLSTAVKSTPLSRWLAGHLIRFATAESVALFGFFLRMMGSTSNLVIVLFAGSLLLLLFWQPGEVPAANESMKPMG